MNGSQYRVGLVLHEGYGDRLLELVTRMPVWVVDTPVNRAAAQRTWQANPESTHLTGITTFKIEPTETAVDRRLGVLGTIDLHHGEYSADPPYSELEVFGLALSDDLRQAFLDEGFNRFEATQDGFVAYRGTR